MYLRVNNDGKNLYYKFDDNKLMDKPISVGRSDKSDICIIADGVSRNHLQIFSKNGEYFIKDLGATNGSFINEQKLSPNEEIPFNTFFPVQLGFHAKIYLIDEAENTKSIDLLVKETQDALSRN